MKRAFSIVVAALNILLALQQEADAVERRLLRLDGPVIFDVGQAATPRDLRIQDGVQFGGFRSGERNLADEQYIKYWIEPVMLPNGKALPVLAVYYNVSKAESYCGIWLKLGGADWTRYRDGDIVLRLRRFEPLNKVAVFDRDRKRVPDTDCTDNLKVELKTGYKDEQGRRRQFAARKDIWWEGLNQQRLGYFDIRIPLRDFGLDAYLDNVALFAITFENRSIGESQRRGNLGLQRIVLTSKRDESVDTRQFAKFVNSAPGKDSGPDAPDLIAASSAVPRKPVKLNGPLVIRFDVPLDQLNVPKTQFGIFRDEDPRPIQYIEEDWASIGLPHKAKPTGFLRLRYEVPEKFNGWWLKLLGADWSAYDTLVLRLRPGKNCTPLFKVELKTFEGGESYPAYVRLTEEHAKSWKELGYADVSIPLREFGIYDLSRLEEFVIVFESNHIPYEYTKGELLIESIRLLRSGARQAPESVYLLDDLGQLGFMWFVHHCHPKSGMVLDRAPNWKGRGHPSAMSSIASTGYYLSLLPEWARQGWITREAAEQRALQSLDFALNTLPHHEGLFYHFIDCNTGARWERSEVSTLDSAIFFNGCMVVSQAFGGKVAELADVLVDRANWPAFIVKHPKSGKSLLSLGWTPEKGLLGPADVRSSEMAMPIFLAIGSRTHPVDPECWYNTTVNYGELADKKILNRTHPLFTSNFSVVGWHDLRGKVDRDGVDLYSNARLAALANRAVCNQLAGQFKTYAPDGGGWWGISAGDSPAGYVAAAPVSGGPDGTVWPLAALATISLIPDEVNTDLSRWRYSYVWPAVCGEYGLSPFNLDRRWRGNDLIGIDVGSFCLSLANYRNRTGWDFWMQHPIAQRAIARIYSPQNEAFPVKMRMIRPSHSRAGITPLRISLPSLAA